MDTLKSLAYGHCSNISKMEVIDGMQDLVEYYDDHTESYVKMDAGTFYQLTKCPACGELNIFRYYWDESLADKDINYELIDPHVNINIPKGLPSSIESEYRIANRIKSLDIDLYTIAMRRLLERVCIDCGAKPKTIAEMLKELAEKNTIPYTIVQVALHLKNFGNIGAHVNDGQLSKNEIPIIQSLADAILIYLYEAPSLVSIAEQKLKMIHTHK